MPRLRRIYLGGNRENKSEMEAEREGLKQSAVGSVVHPHKYKEKTGIIVRICQVRIMESKLQQC